jgi:hypothetical protein
MKRKIAFLVLSLVMCLNLQSFSQSYKGFRVAVYVRAYEVREMSNLKRLDSLWTIISRQLKVDKIYLETHRDNVIVDDKTIESVKKYFTDKGIEVAGGITYTIDERNRFQTFCYSTLEQRKKAKEIAELTAKHFDEFILDDFFFTNCKCESCIKAKGDLSWTQFRLKLMTEAVENLILKPAKAINPKVKVVIKYPNWYEHFQGMGFNLETEPKIFDGIYTGTETRDPIYSNQHLQQYESYLIFRYFENIKPGGNGGGWVDTGGMIYADRYAEQLWLTLFAKAPEVTLFDFGQLLIPLRKEYRAQWQDQKPSFDFDEMRKPYETSDGTTVTPSTIARVAGYSFECADKVVSQLGKPVGIKSYKPYNSIGEDFLQNYFGMIGIPIELVPEFPVESKMIFLTESAKQDPDIVEKIKTQLQSGKNVTITTGLLRALQGKGIEDIAELKYTDRKASIKNFAVGWNWKVESTKEILIPQIEYLTNDVWEEISSFNGASGFPILISANYGKGTLYVLTIPENYSDIYNYPVEVLNRIRQYLTGDVNIRIECGSQISLFIYDNNTFIIQSFKNESTQVKLALKNNSKKIKDILNDEEFSLKSEKSPMIWGKPPEDVATIEVSIKPHSYRVFKLE